MAENPWEDKKRWIRKSRVEALRQQATPGRERISHMKCENRSRCDFPGSQKLWWDHIDTDVKAKETEDYSTNPAAAPGLLNATLASLWC
ncbi:unnamed protein product [Peronospora farinosa]|nr:unnamed protein product [Peronospora farinosa]CAI5738702.1 unnamed protein product [Peronospora farinosa]